jgi:hypothetical protein
MSSINITFDDKEVTKFLNNAIKKSPKEFSKATNTATIETLKKFKMEWPKRSGGSRKSFLLKKLNEFAWVIFSKNKAVKIVNDGSPKHVIKPKNRKFLTIPLRDSVLTSTKAKIKQSALTNLFKLLKDEDDPADAMKKAGIVLTKKVNHPGSKGKKLIEKKFGPFAQKRLNKYVVEALRRLGYG